MVRSLLPARRVVRTVRRLGLHSRLTAAFALGSLMLSLLLAALAYGLMRENLVDQRERDATSEVYANALTVRARLRGDAVDPRQQLDGLGTPDGARPVLFSKGQWYALDVDRARKALPKELRSQVLERGEAARMRHRIDGESALSVGVPLPAVEAAYFEISSLDELDSTLQSLLLSLGAAALLTTLAGAGLGAAFSRRVLRPLAEVRQAAVAIAGGRLDTRVATVDDADLGALVASFNDMARALQERIERDARFASDVSHELRSPLTTLSASIEVLEGRRDEMPERSRAALDLLVADVGRFSAMVADLLEISRFDAGAASLDLDEVRVAELTRNALQFVHHADVPMRVAPDAESCVIYADKRRMVRVIANLLDNADRYAGGATGVAVELAGEDVRVIVEDAGPGVAEEDRERIFERFSRGTSAGRRVASEGTGLGLALVREHVTLHGGKVWVEDRNGDGPGARFVVEMPGELSEAEPEPEADLGPAAVPAVEADVVEV